MVGELAHGGKFEQVSQGNFCLQDFLQIGMHSDQAQGITTKVEKIVVEPDVRNSQDALPEFRQCAFELAARKPNWRGPLFRSYLQLGEGRTIHLSVLRKGKR